jgi:hypothetical protein
MTSGERDDLLAREAILRAEADAMLAASGIGAILGEAGYVTVGSYAMRTMVWRDLDLECYQDADWETHWDVGRRLAQTGWCWRLNCVDAYRQGEKGLYWGCRVADPTLNGVMVTEEPSGWKLDVWRAPREDFESHPAWPRRRLWAELMSEEKRASILAIKGATCRRPEYRKTMLSVHVYEAVLERGIETPEGFVEWWAAHCL